MNESPIITIFFVSGALTASVHEKGSCSSLVIYRDTYEQYDEHLRMILDRKYFPNSNRVMTTEVSLVVNQWLIPDSHKKWIDFHWSMFCKRNACHANRYLSLPCSVIDQSLLD